MYHIIFYTSIELVQKNTQGSSAQLGLTKLSSHPHPTLLFLNPYFLLFSFYFFLQLQPKAHPQAFIGPLAEPGTSFL